MKNLSENRRGLAHFAESAEQNVPVPLSSAGFRVGSYSDRTRLERCERRPQSRRLSKSSSGRAGLKTVWPWSARKVGLTPPGLEVQP